MLATTSLQECLRGDSYLAADCLIAGHLTRRTVTRYGRTVEQNYVDQAPDRGGR